MRAKCPISMNCWVTTTAPKSNVAMRYLDQLQASTGMSYLTKEVRAQMSPLCGGLQMSRVETKLEADEIAAALSIEMSRMARATEKVWYGLRASVFDALPGVRFNPLVLVGSKKG